jgi:hypothetical protein
VGRFVVEGCETSPADPAPCPREVVFGRSEITLRGPVFPERRWPYRVVSREAGRVAIEVQGETTDFERRTDGRARWRLHAISRVRSLSLRSTDEAP